MKSIRPIHVARSAVSYIPSASLLGLRGLPERLRPSRPHEKDFEAFEAFVPRSPVILDVGANRGQSIRSFRMFFDEPTIHAVEPNSMLAEHLRKKEALGGGQVHNVALSDESGLLTLHVPRYGHTHYDTRASGSREQAASFLTGESFLFFQAERAGVETLEVDMVTLDSLGVAPDILKIDVEGADHRVVVGGEATIRQNEPLLLIEEPTRSTIETLVSWGYQPWDYVDGSLQPPSSTSLNTFFLAPRHDAFLASLRG